MYICGISETDITPSMGMEIPGYFARRLAAGVLDPLSALTAYFENDGDRAVLISCDAIGVPLSVCDRARHRIAEALSMTPDAVLICATHSHTGGPVEHFGSFCQENNPYLAFLEERIVDGAILAKADARPVTLRFVKTAEDKLAYYRNYVMPDGSYQTWCGPGAKPYGEIDPEVCVLRIDNADGSPYGCLVNYACHCDCVGGDSYSADYPGAMRAALRRMYGEDFRPMYLNGANGNINHCDPNGFHNVPYHFRRMGRILACDVSRAMEIGGEALADDGISAVYRVLTMERRAPDASLIAWAEKVAADPDASVMDAYFAGEALRFRDEGARTVAVPVQVIAVGPLAIFAMPGEMYVEFGKMCKKLRPRAMVASLANAAVGYVPIRELFQPGIYEARLCEGSQLPPDAGYRMVEALAEMAETLF